ncbi:DUF72 domain-containing protein [Candidatus Bathyarchaeota archaeon]|nr:DUF72 domain-containing protein [Candidatus Bathyarchaeota archaeon]
MEGLYLGFMGWSYGFWGIYPEKMKSTEYLVEYATRFSSVEINNSFYRIPRASAVDNWARQVPDGFRFAAKFPGSVTHSKGLDYEPGKLEAFLTNISRLGEKMGPLLLQFPPTLKPDQVGGLKDLLDSLPPGKKYAAEFRHRDWFTEATYSLLRDSGVALAYVDHPWLPTVDEQTSNFAYRKKVDGEKGAVQLDREADLNAWATRIAGLLEAGIAVYGYFSKFFSGYPLSDIQTLTEAVKSARGS